MKNQLDLAYREDDRTPAQSLPVPLTIIRTETVLSKLPVHNLSRQEFTPISIVQRNEMGAVTLRWEVSYSGQLGAPRALAYRIDTLAVNRRIDELPKPLPKLIRLGSLREICREVGLIGGGKNNTDVRCALYQNAAAFIKAKLAYRGTDKSERLLEAGFTRYNVLFTGEKLPNGQSADAVYLILNQPYWEVLNNAPARPLDYDYLRELKPAAQRFYEMVSYSVYAALVRQQRYARLIYSDYCTRAPRKRKHRRDEVRRQMQKVLEPHRHSGYLSDFRLNAILDTEGEQDFEMLFAPGPKARTEFAAFTRKQRDKARALDPGAEQGRAEPPSLPAAADVIESKLVTQLVKRGITRKRAYTIVRSAEDEDALQDQLEWGDYLIRNARSRIKNPAGFHISLIENAVVPPADFETTRRRRAHEETANRRAEAQQRRAALELAYTTYRRERVAAYIETPEGKAAYDAGLEPAKKKTRTQWRKLPATTIAQLAHHDVCHELANRLGLMSFQEYEQSQGKDVAGA